MNLPLLTFAGGPWKRGALQGESEERAGKNGVDRHVLGRQSASLAAGLCPTPYNLISLQLGYALLRDRRVSIRTKLIALGLGAGTVGAIELLQLPVEGVFAALLPHLAPAEIHSANQR